MEGRADGATSSSAVIGGSVGLGIGDTDMLGLAVADGSGSMLGIRSSTLGMPSVSDCFVQ